MFFFSGMVSFTEASNKYNDIQAEVLHKHIRKSMELSRRLDSLRSEVKQSEEFKQKKTMSQQGKAGTAPGFF